MKTSQSSLPPSRVLASVRAFHNNKYNMQE